jgi:hypothetical protein
VYYTLVIGIPGRRVWYGAGSVAATPGNITATNKRYFSLMSMWETHLVVSHDERKKELCCQRKK